MAPGALTSRIYANLFSLRGRVVLLTGGYGHLGRAIAPALGAHGAVVVVLGRNERAFDAAFAQAPERASIHFVRCDTADSRSVQQAFAACRSAYGLPAVLVNNAFFTQGADPDTLTDAEFATGLDGSLGSTYRCIREALPYLRERGGGKIINVASMYGVVAPDFATYAAAPEFTALPHYAAAKAGVIQLTRYFAAFLAGEHVQVNCVTPGPFPNPDVQRNRAFIEALEQRVPLGRIGQPDDLVGSLVFLSAPASDFVTGHNLVVDGGWTIR